MAWRTPVSSTPASPIQYASTSNAGLKVSPLALSSPDPLLDSPHLYHGPSQGHGHGLGILQPQPLTLVIPTLHKTTSWMSGSRRAEHLHPHSHSHAHSPHPHTHHTHISPRQVKPHSNRLKGHKISHSMSMMSMEIVPPPHDVEDSWVAPLGKFDIEQEAIELSGFRIYAVEKWVVERSKFMKVVVVYTGETRDVITVSVITPSSTLTNEEAQQEFDNATKILRRDGAKSRNTPLGLIMVTSLANFRSDLNIVKIDEGDFVAARDVLYVNINLLRLGCSGRTALTLEAPSEAVREGFRQLYSIHPVAIKSIGFNTVVLEFIKLIQSALSIFDLYSQQYLDGLLCDTMVDSIQRWTLEIGELLKELSLEPTERVLEPSVAAGILSVVASMRSKMLAIMPTTTNMPKDPFLHPVAFTEALAVICPAHINTSRTQSTGQGSAPARAFLNAAFVDHINREYKRKTVESKTSRMPNLNPINLLPADSFPSIASSPVVSSIGSIGNIAAIGSGKTPVEAIVAETSDLSSFSRSTSVVSKDPIESLQLVWTGKMGPSLSHAKHLHEMEQRRATEDREREKEREHKSDHKSGDDEEGLFGKRGIWALKQSLQGVRQKKHSVDMSSLRSLHVPMLSSARTSPNPYSPHPSMDQDARSANFSPIVPSDGERALSADEGAKARRSQSPTRAYSQPQVQSRRPLLSALGTLPAPPLLLPAFSSDTAFSQTPMETPTEKNRSRPKSKSLDITVKLGAGFGMEPGKGTGQVIGPGTGLSKHKRTKRASKLRQLLEELPSQSQTYELDINSDDDSMRHRMRLSRHHPANIRLKSRNSVLAHNTIRRRHSFGDLDQWRTVPHLTREQMAIDVHFVSSIRELRRRKQRLSLAGEAIKELTRPLPLVKAILETNAQEQKEEREDLNRRVDTIMPGIEDLASIRKIEPQLRNRKLTALLLRRDAPIKQNAVAAAEMLKSAKYKASADLSRIVELRNEVRKHRQQFWQQRRLAYLPPETKLEEADEELNLALGSKCPFIWSLQFLYKLMLLAVMWAGMFRRGEMHIQPDADDGWRRSTVFGTRLDSIGRTQVDLELSEEEAEEDKGLDWTMKPSNISAQTFAQL